jgi:hypothetical protein
MCVYEEIISATMQELSLPTLEVLIGSLMKKYER